MINLVCYHNVLYNLVSNKKGAVEDFFWFDGVLKFGIPGPFAVTYLSNRKEYLNNLDKGYPWERGEAK